MKKQTIASYVTSMSRNALPNLSQFMFFSFLVPEIEAHKTQWNTTQTKFQLCTYREQVLSRERRYHTELSRGLFSFLHRREIIGKRCKRTPLEFTIDTVRSNFSLSNVLLHFFVKKRERERKRERKHFELLLR